MKKPQTPPAISGMLHNSFDKKKLDDVMRRAVEPPDDYPHWDKLRHLTPPEGLSTKEWWLGIKLRRGGLLKDIPLLDKEGKPFRFGVPDLVQAELHDIDVGAGRSIGIPEPITNPQTRDRYLIRSLIEEAITSSQLEGAATTREVAKEMIRTGRPPRDTSERMILNNYLTMKRITELKKDALSPEMVFAIHRLVTEKTLPDATAAGRFRRPDEKRVVGDDFGEIFHNPPSAEELPGRLQAMCDFANGKTPGFFVHPAVRAIILHFWLAYDHPFVDGNGRTARALFYWGMLHAGYWLFEFISISSILRKAPVKYGLSFLYSETDANDLTYFIVAQTKVIRRAIEELHAYIDRKTVEVRELEAHVRALGLFNHRQAELVRHALKHPYQEYTIASHGKSHNVVYQTARTDLLDLKARGVLAEKKRGKKMVFTVPRDLTERLRRMEKEARDA
ncbi:MAG: Fic family protein [Kiritimatiellia bacterium]|nr:Fic family protein [Kiritimatiellia bacterium]